VRSGGVGQKARQKGKFQRFYGTLGFDSRRRSRKLHKANIGGVLPRGSEGRGNQDRMEIFQRTDVGGGHLTAGLRSSGKP